MPLRITVFDGDLTLIKVKQQQRGYFPGGVTIGEIDWPKLAAGLGVSATCAANEAQLRQALAESRDHSGPFLIAAKISPSIYESTLRALRG